MEATSSAENGTTVPYSISTDINSATLYKGNTSTIDQFGEGADIWLIYLSYLVVPLFFVLGLCGNLLTILITRCRLYRYSSHGIYLRAMAFNDIIFLLAFPFNKQFVHDLIGMDVRSVSIAGCKIYVLVYRASRISAALFIVQICIERFIVVWFPLKAKRFSSRRMAIICVCCTCIVISGFCGVWSIAAVIDNGKCIPVLLTQTNKQTMIILSICGTILRTFLPASMLLCFTPITLIKLYSQRALRRQMSRYRGPDETYRTTIMLLSVVVAFLVLTVPFCLMKHILLFNGTNIVIAPLRWARNLFEISQLCEQTDCVINFILYVVFSSSFRRYLSWMLKFNRTRDNSPSICIETISNRNM